MKSVKFVVFWILVILALGLGDIAQAGGKGRQKSTAGPGYCPEGNCWPKNLSGDYITMLPYQNSIRVVLNGRNPKYLAKVISAKVEFHNAGHPGWYDGTGWGKTFVIRNAQEADATAVFEALSTQGPLLDSYLNQVMKLKGGTAGQEGDSCFEATIAFDGTLIKYEGPQELLSMFPKRW